MLGIDCCNRIQDTLAVVLWLPKESEALIMTTYKGLGTTQKRNLELIFEGS